MSPCRALRALAVALLAACGPTACGSQANDPGPGDLLAATLPGTWVLDMERSALGAGGPPPGLGGQRHERAPAQAALAGGDYSITFSEGGTFTLLRGTGDEAFRLEGAWRAGEGWVDLTTLVANGQPLERVDQAAERYRFLGDKLVLATEHLRIHLRRAGD